MMPQKSTIQVVAPWMRAILKPLETKYDGNDEPIEIERVPGAAFK